MSDDEYDYDEQELPECAEWCDRCQGDGIANCYCGGDQCYCLNYGEMECPTCDGKGWWIPTPAQVEGRARMREVMRDAFARSPNPLPKDQ